MNNKSITIVDGKASYKCGIPEQFKFRELLKNEFISVCRFSGEVKDSNFAYADFIVLIIPANKRTERLKMALNIAEFTYSMQSLESGGVRFVVELKARMGSTEAYLTEFDKWKLMFPEVSNKTRKVDFILSPDNGFVGEIIK